MKKIDLNNKTILITGAAGFIGSHLANRLCKDFNVKVIGLDNINDYYDTKLKEYRLNNLLTFENFKFIKGNIADKELIYNIFKEYKPSIVVNLAAQAGARDSVTNPDAYIESNIIGFYNILEACRKYPVEHLVYASSSSIYGDNKKVPFSIDDKTDTPISLYAATKKSNELMSYTYSKNYKIPTTGLRFFTVYGPAGRPDMAYFRFTDKLVNKEKIQVYNYGKCKRDFTYIDDIVEGIIKVIQGVPEKDTPYNIYNIGNSNSIEVLEFINILEEELIKTKVLPKDFDFDEYEELLPMQKGDVEITFSDNSSIEKDFGFKPKTNLKDGLKKFVEWYKEYYIKDR